MHNNHKPPANDYAPLATIHEDPAQDGKARALKCSRRIRISSFGTLWGLVYLYSVLHTSGAQCRSTEEMSMGRQYGRHSLSFDTSSSTSCITCTVQVIPY